MKTKTFYVYHRAGYDLQYALKNRQVANSYDEALANLKNEYLNMNPSRGYIPDTEIFIYKISISGTNVTVNDGDYELEPEERKALLKYR
jgi:hypothetical protein